MEPGNEEMIQARCRNDRNIGCKQKDKDVAHGVTREKKKEEEKKKVGIVSKVVDL